MVYYMSSEEKPTDKLPKDGVNKRVYKLPELTFDEREKIAAAIPEMQDMLSRLSEQYGLLRENYPDQFDEVAAKHPKLSQNIDTAASIARMLRSTSDEELVALVDEYNALAHDINFVLAAVGREQAEGKESMLVQAANGELPFDERQLTEAQKQALRDFAQDLFKELFPDSTTDKFVKRATSQSQLEGYQKVLLAPANGVEWAVMGFIDIFKPKTYHDLAATVQSMTGMDYKDWCAVWKTIKFAYEQLPATDKVAPLLSLLVAVASVCGGARTIIKFLKGHKYPAGLTRIIEGLVLARTATRMPSYGGKALPLAVMAGITLPYIDKSSHGR